MRYVFEVRDKSFEIQVEYVVMGILIVQEKKVHSEAFVWFFGDVFWRRESQTCFLDSANETNS